MNLGKTKVISQFTPETNILVAGVLSVTGDIVDNTDPTNPIVMDGVKTIKRSLTAGQIRGMAASHVSLLPAPGAGKAYQIIAACISFHYGGVSFDHTNSLRVGAVGAATYQIDAKDCFMTTASYFKTLPLINNSSAYVTNVVENAALEITSDSTASVGNSTADLYVTYRIITL
jgi:hypothetical protein